MAAALDDFLRMLQEHDSAPVRKRLAIRQRIDERFGANRSVLIGDLSGFSRRLADEGPVPFVSQIYRLRRLATPIVRGHGGYLFKAYADQILASFFSAEAAVLAARETMRRAFEDSLTYDPDDRLALKIGVATGRVLAIGEEEVWGHAVAIASFLEGQAAPGELFVCAETQAAVKCPGEGRSATVSGIPLRYYRIDAPVLGTG